MSQTQRSPRVTKRQTRSQRGDVSEDSVGSHDCSYISSHSEEKNSPYSSPSFHRSRNDSNTYDSDRTTPDRSFFSDSPDKSRSFTSSRLYPDISGELNESGDFSYTRIADRKEMRGKRESASLKNYASSTPPPDRHSAGHSSASPKRLITVSNKSNSGSPIVWVIIGFVVAVCVILYLVTASPSSNSNPNSSKFGFDYFEDELKTLRRSFPSQTNRFWATVYASARHVFEQQDPCYPSVILMASHKKNQRLNMCLAKKIASTFSSSVGVNPSSVKINTDVEDFKHLDSDKQKLQLDEDMQSAFQQDGGKAFVISNVHSLSPRAALLLHGFCDGDNAPFKDVMIILTFQVKDQIIFKSVKELERYLTEIWSHGLEMDKLSPLMSRIANNPVVLQGEDQATVDKFCQ